MSTWIHMISGWRHQTTRPPLVQPFLLHQNRIRDEDLLLALGLGKKGDEKRGKCLNAPILGKNHCNPHYITTVISTINHWIQPLINQLNAIGPILYGCLWRSNCRGCHLHVPFPKLDSCVPILRRFMKWRSGKNQQVSCDIVNICYI